MELLENVSDFFRDDNSFSKWLLLHFMDRDRVVDYRDSIIEGEPVELVISMNGVELTKVDMDEAMNEIARLKLEEISRKYDQLEKDKEHFKEKVEERALELIQEKMEGLEELFCDVKTNLSFIDSLASKNISWKIGEE